MELKKLLKKKLSIITYRIAINLIKTRKYFFNSILVLAPHPDDEIIGVGGIIIKTLKNNGRVYIVYLSDGEKSGASSNMEEIKKQRISMTKTILKQLNIKSENITRLHLPDSEFKTIGENKLNEVVSHITNLVEVIKPDALFATAKSDYWPHDHVVCSEIARMALSKSNFKSELWFYWVWTWYHLKPWQLSNINYNHTYKIKIKSELDMKKELMKIYLEPVSENNIPWSGNLPDSMIYPFFRNYEILEKSLN